MYVDAKEFLEDIRRKGKDIQNYKKALSAIDKDLEASAINYDPNTIKTNVPRKDGLEELAFKHLEKRDRIIRALERAITERAEAIEMAVAYINKIEQPKQREILIWYYIEGKEWSEIFKIREDAGLYDAGAAFELRARGVDSLNKIMMPT